MNRQHISYQCQVPFVTVHTEQKETKQKENWSSKEELIDESDWEIYGILHGEESINDKFFVSYGNEDVVLQEYVSQLQRCSVSFDC